MQSLIKSSNLFGNLKIQTCSTLFSLCDEDFDVDEDSVIKCTHFGYFLIFILIIDVDEDFVTKFCNDINNKFCQFCN